MASAFGGQRSIQLSYGRIVSPPIMAGESLFHRRIRRGRELPITLFKPRAARPALDAKKMQIALPDVAKRQHDEDVGGVEGRVDGREGAEGRAEAQVAFDQRRQGAR